MKTIIRYIKHRRMCKNIGISKPFGFVEWLMSDNNGGVKNVLL